MEPAEKKEQFSEESELHPEKCFSQQDTLAHDSSTGVEESNETPISEESALHKELNSKMEEYQLLNDKYLRLAAEFENYKRRSHREQSDTVRFGNEKILKDLLPTIDNLERAIQCGQEQTNNHEGLLQGIELTHKQFVDTLTKLGVSQISSVGERFDPAKHQAVANVESATIPENHVVDEYQKGYFLHERILRPSMVTVATARPENSTPDENESAALRKENTHE